MKKILISLAIIGAVGAIVAGVTTAFFSDTETSTGNTFTAGSLDLKVDSGCYYNGKHCEWNQIYEKWYWDGDPNLGECYCAWEPRDLTNEKFFEFSDVKPGDWGESTISLRVHDNKAWACAKLDNIASDDNGCTEPESPPEGTDETCGDENGKGGGELDQNIEAFFWYDIDCDNSYDPSTETLTYGPLSVSDFPAGWMPITDSTTETPPLEPDHVYCMGVAWCVGEMSIDGETGQITCNGSSVGNIIQSDSLSGDISFYIEQYKNNPDFECSELQL